MNQLRDSKGRFVKWEGVNEIESYGLNPTLDSNFYDEPELVISRSVRLAIWWSTNWTTVIGYTAYAILCLVLGMAGGIMGVRVSL